MKPPEQLHIVKKGFACSYVGTSVADLFVYLNAYFVQMVYHSSFTTFDVQMPNIAIGRSVGWCRIFLNYCDL